MLCCYAIIKDCVVCVSKLHRRAETLLWITISMGKHLIESFLGIITSENCDVLPTKKLDAIRIWTIISGAVSGWRRVSLIDVIAWNATSVEPVSVCRWGFYRYSCAGYPPSWAINHCFVCCFMADWWSIILNLFLMRRLHYVTQIELQFEDLKQFVILATSSIQEGTCCSQHLLLVIFHP